MRSGAPRADLRSSVAGALQRPFELTHDGADVEDDDFSSEADRIAFAHSVVTTSAAPRTEPISSEPLQVFLARTRSQLIERFVYDMREHHVGREDASRTELIEHLPFFLADVEDALDRDDSAHASMRAGEHGQRRFRLGFDLGGVLYEYAILRRCILRMMDDEGLSPTLREVDVLNRCLDAAMSDAAVSYARERDVELEEERERLRVAVRSRDDLVAIVSHDLRNPLTAITLGITQLRRAGSEKMGERSERVLDSIARSADRMGRLIEDLLAIAKIEAGQLHIEAATIDARSIVEDAVMIARPLAETKSIAVHMSLPDEPLLVACDRGRVQQVIENLVGNALKFTGPGGAITVRAEVDDATVRFVVEDNGPGIAPEALPYVFDRFWQGPGRTSIGAGLGLAIARGVIDAHGGTMMVESTLGRGSTFSFTLPRAGAGVSERPPH